MIIPKKAYAKINLYLEILDKLPNGYHNIFTVMQKISLCDDIILNINKNISQNININCSDKNIPADKTNTVYKATELFFEYITGAGFSRPDTGITIEIIKKIPTQAGLGGGSSDAAAVLLELNKYFDFILPERILIEIAAKIGADVPFFVKNINCAVCEGIGETVMPVDIDLTGYFCLIVKPVYNISTKQAYDDWDKFKNAERGMQNAELKNKIRNSGFQIKNIRNDFAELIFSQNNNIYEIKKYLLKSNAVAAELSGSGSALFGIFDDLENARECRDILIQRNDIEFCDIFDFLC
ncbi:MAG: 4-(cytidine 5'-diphospho)-2-C-methyl-D-erythritol kinase [Oscillospiraceae bacterium]|nr:4-(cytidine 5'-diphospho)-2-C-methyl-D-erythritol kinase [Oscillospiraceae bacterium]